MNSRLTALILILLLNSCSTTKTVSFKTLNDKGKSLIYSLELPKGYKLTKLSFENENVQTYTYADSSRIFFSDNLAPSSFYKDAYKKYGKDLNLTFLSRDTITISGQDEEGRYWKTCKDYNVVYGYTQVPGEKLNQFEHILNSFKQTIK